METAAALGARGKGAPVVLTTVNSDIHIRVPWAGSVAASARSLAAVLRCDHRLADDRPKQRAPLSPDAPRTKPVHAGALGQQAATDCPEMRSARAPPSVSPTETRKAGKTKPNWFAASRRRNRSLSNQRASPRSALAGAAWTSRSRRSVCCILAPGATGGKNKKMTAATITCTSLILAPPSGQIIQRLRVLSSASAYRNQPAGRGQSSRQGDTPPPNGRRAGRNPERRDQFGAPRARRDPWSAETRRVAP